MKKYILAAALMLSSASFASCNDLYPTNKPIAVDNTVELCNTFYVSKYDVQHRAVVLVSERLRKDAAVGDATRLNAFRSDPRISAGPLNSEYANTGFDRGHMAPADDASTRQEMYETFYLTNMTPQKPKLNRASWKALEDRVRKIWAASDEDVFVLTIAVYNKPEYMNNIPVPNGYWKIVYAGNSKRYFFAENKDNAQVKEYSPVDISKITSPKW